MDRVSVLKGGNNRRTETFEQVFEFHMNIKTPCLSPPPPVYPTRQACMVAVMLFLSRLRALHPSLLLATPMYLMVYISLLFSVVRIVAAVGTNVQDSDKSFFFAWTHHWRVV